MKYIKILFILSNIQRYKTFLELCAKQDITVIVQIWVKERLWGGDNYGGTEWAKVDKLTNYPADIDKSYGSFVRDLVKFMKDSGISDNNIILEAWNEPDLLWGVAGNPLTIRSHGKYFLRKVLINGQAEMEKWKALHHVLNSTYPNIR